MHEEYAGREVAMEVAAPLLDRLREGNPGSRSQALTGKLRISWDELCNSLDEADGDVDLHELGRAILSEALPRYRRRVNIATRLLTFADALRFLVYPRHPVDLACVDVAVTAEPGRVDMVAYIQTGYRHSDPFFEVLRGACERLAALFDLEDRRINAHTAPGHCHFVVTYTPATHRTARARHVFSGWLLDLYSLAVVGRSYPYLVHSHRLFEEQVVERSRVESLLRRGERAFDHRMRHTEDVIVEFDEHQRIDYVSPNIERRFGVRMAAFRETPQDYIVVETLTKLWYALQRVYADGETVRVDDFAIVDQHDQSHWFEVTLAPLPSEDGKAHAIGVARDVTERRRLLEERRLLDGQFERTARLEMMGVLAGGIAHDFNNLLVPLMGEADLARDEADTDSLRERLDTIKDAAQQAADLVRQLMVYSGTDAAPHFASVDLSGEVQRTIDLARKAIDPLVHLEATLPDEAPVLGDASQLRQVVLNLLINAAEAIVDSPGTIGVTVTTSNESVQITVTDDGCGMDEKTRDRALEPFYSTKFAGRGLGLASVAGIVRAHSGRIDIESWPGVGTTVHIHLPAAAQTSSVAPRPVRAANGQGRVLLVDDDAGVLRAGKAMLETGGFEVIEANGGEAAISALGDPRFDAVVLDLVMPDINGREVLRHARNALPHLPVLLVSGYGDRQISDVLESDPYTQFLPKPYRPRQLNSALLDHLRACRGRDDRTQAHLV